MTISTQTFRFPYTSTGGATYPYTNKILDQDDLRVYVNDTLQTIGTHYTVTGVGAAAGGNVVFVSAPTAGSSVLITKDGVEFTQETDYVENDSFPAESHENALDKLTNIAQKIWDYTRRSIKLKITSSLTDLEFPDPEADKYLAWNSTKTAIVNRGIVVDSALITGAMGASMVAADYASEVVSLIGAVSDDTYASSTWDGVSGVAPSKNAVYDKLQLMAALFPASLGAANLKQFMNAAGTAPEWATEFKLLQITRDLTAIAGDVSYTGVGFKPAGYIVMATASNADIVELSLGLAVGVNMANLCLLARTTPIVGVTTTRIVISERGASDGSKNQVAVVKTNDADGFTWTWTKASTPSGTLTMYVLCFR
jgi:hypothetical protein